MDAATPDEIALAEELLAEWNEGRGTSKSQIEIRIWNDATAHGRRFDRFIRRTLGVATSRKFTNSNEAFDGEGNGVAVVNIVGIESRHGHDLRSGRPGRPRSRDAQSLPMSMVRSPAVAALDQAEFRRRPFDVRATRKGSLPVSRRVLSCSCRRVSLTVLV
jgi:hypothetical protein